MNEIVAIMGFPNPIEAPPTSHATTNTPSFTLPSTNNFKDPITHSHKHKKSFSYAIVIPFVFVGVILAIVGVRACSI